MSLIEQILPGTYRARATSFDLGFTQSNAEQLIVQFQLLDEGFEGKFLTWYGSFSEKAAPYTLESMRHCGWKSDDLSDLTGMDANEVSLVVIHEADQKNVMQVRVRYVNGISAVRVKAPLSQAQKAAFAQRMKGLAVMSRQSAQPGAAPAGSRPAPSRGGPVSPEPPPIAEDPNAPPF